MKFIFRSGNKRKLEGLAGLLEMIGQELGAEFTFTLPSENQQGLYVSEIADAGWGNALKPIVEFLAVADQMVVEEGDPKRAEVAPCSDVAFKELRQKYIRAAGPLWIRMGMCRIKDDIGGEKFMAMDLVGPLYLAILSSLVRCMGGVEIVYKNKEKIKTKTISIEAPIRCLEGRKNLDLLLGGRQSAPALLQEA